MKTNCGLTQPNMSYLLHPGTKNKTQVVPLPSGLKTVARWDFGQKKLAYPGHGDALWHLSRVGLLLQPGDLEEDVVVEHLVVVHGVEDALDADDDARDVPGDDRHEQSHTEGQQLRQRLPW